MLKDLPDKVRTVIPVDFNTKADKDKMAKHMESIREDAITIVNENKVGSKLTMAGKSLLFSEISKLWEETFDYKFEQIKGFLDDVLIQKEKVVIFVYHRDAYAKIAKYLKSKKIKYVGILGGTKDIDRNKAEKDFQNNKDIKVFLGTIGAAKESLTLTASSDVIFLEMDWVPGHLNQAEDRCHRIGQKGSVNTYYVVLNESIDVNMVKLLMKKIDIISRAISGVIIESDEKGNVNMFDGFIDDFIQRKQLKFKKEGKK